MTSAYHQKQPKIEYDFSDENIHRVAANNREKGIKNNDAFGLENITNIKLV